MDDDDHLQATLAQLAGEGRVDSQGGFSVNLRRSVSKLAHFQHKHPHTFLRHLLSAAVALQAENIWMNLRGNRWQVFFDGQELSFEDLKGIFPSLAASQPGPRGVACRELALGLNSLRGIESCRAVLSVPSGQLELTPTYLQVSPSKGDVSPQPGPSRTQLEVRSLGWVDRLRFYGTEALLPQDLPHLNLNELIRLSRLAPLRRFLNQQELEPDLNWGACLGVLRLTGRAFLPELRFQAPWVQEETHSEDMSLVVALYPSEMANSTSILHWGLLYDQSDRSLPLEARVLAAHPGLKSDLQGDQLVKDQTLQGLVLAIRRQVAMWGARLLAQGQPGDPALAGLRGDLKKILAHYPEVVEIAQEALDSPLQPGGGLSPCAPPKILRLHSRQGFIHFDPEATSEETKAELRELCQNAIAVTPYRPLQEGPYLLRIPFADGEIRFRRDVFAPPEESLPYLQLLLPLGLAHPEELEIDLVRRPTLASRASWTDQFRLLAAAWVTRLQEGAVDDFLGSAPALRLALWLAQEHECIQVLSHFCLRLYPTGRVTLESVMKASCCPFVAEGREQYNRGREKPPLWLSVEEAGILAALPVHLLEYGAALERRLTCVSSPEEMALEVIYEAVERVKGNAGAFLRLGEEGRLHHVAGADLPPGALEQWQDSGNRQRLLSSLLSRVNEPLGTGSAKVPNQPGLWSYLAAPLRPGDERCLLLVARRAEAGVFTASEGGALMDLARQAEQLLASLA